MSAKELGQIHTVNQQAQFLATLEGSTPFVAANIDVPGLLTDQLQRMVRCGNYFKTVGIDISLGLQGRLNQSFVASGYLRYYAPTRGRCEAFRTAFKAMADQMSNQGISMRDNPLYDFRAPLNVSSAAATPTFANQATLNGSDGLSLNNATDGLGIFNVHNEGVRPIYQGSNVFSEGFKTLLDNNAVGSRADFVLNDVAPYTGNEMTASLDYETIPFQMSLSTTADENATATFQWRPDPALYLAVMCGQFQLVIEDMQVDDSLVPIEVEVNVSVMVSGWKSIMGNPDKKKKSSRKKLSSKNRSRK